MRSGADGCRLLAEELRGQGGLLAQALHEPRELPVDPAPGPAQVAATGPRARGREREYELLLEMIHEGSRLHYGGARLFSGQDQDLCLLVGDWLYAAGLARLAAIGDLEAVGELADLISLLAQAQAREQPELAAAIWEAGATAVGWGTSPVYERAKAVARDQESGALEAIRTSADRRVS
jgi:hypothetical protein